MSKISIPIPIPIPEGGKKFQIPTNKYILAMPIPILIPILTKNWLTVITVFLCF